MTSRQRGHFAASGVVMAWSPSVGQTGRCARLDPWEPGLLRCMDQGAGVVPLRDGTAGGPEQSSVPVAFGSRSPSPKTAPTRPGRGGSQPPSAAPTKARQQFAADWNSGRIDPDKGRQTITQFRPWWLAQRADPHNGGRTLRASTVRGYESHVRVYLVPTLGQLRLRDLTSDHAEALYQRTREQDKSEAVVQRVHNTLRSAVHFAVKRGYLPSDPLVRVELRPVKRYRAQAWEPDEWGRSASSPSSLATGRCCCWP